MAKFEPCRDCFAYYHSGRKTECTALKRLYCKEGKCHFYKTKKEYDKKLKKYPIVKKDN